MTSTDQASLALDSKSESPGMPVATCATVATSGMLLSACGGGGGSPGTNTQAAQADAARSATVQAGLSTAEASRMLSQAGFGGDDQQTAYLQANGAAAWIESQFATPPDQTHWDWLMAHGYNAEIYMFSNLGIDSTLWRKLMSSPDILRQRITLALSELFVISMAGLSGSWKIFAAAAYMDMLGANAFGNFRTLLEAVTLSPAMGVYLGTRGNQKEDAGTGRQADENYGREIMQLFTIGLYELESDGTLRKDESGKPIDTYSLDTVTQIARVFTGWDFDRFLMTTPDHMQRPMVNNSRFHSTSAKSFLGITVPSGSDAVTELKTTLDTLFNHPNVPQFIGKQLIQRLVTSNPGPAYVARVARAFSSGDGGARGDMKSVIRAILLDPEARPDLSTLTASSGKLREPILRLAQWARTFKASSPGGTWNAGDTSDAGNRLGQSPLRSPSVFNFFRPGFVPSNNALGDPALVAPELQITNESTVVGYANYIQYVIGSGLSDLKPDYSAEIAIASDATALIARLNTLLAAGQLSAATVTLIQSAIATISASTDSGKQNRVKAAIMLVMCSPEYIVQK